MKRAAFLLALLCANVPDIAWAQKPKDAGLPTVGILAMGPQTVFRELATYARFRARMQELGWRDSENIRYIGRGAGGEIGRLDALVQELVRERVTVIVTVGSQEALAAKRANMTIPVVMVHPGDPVQAGIVASLNRPGGNITGNYQETRGLHLKRVELLAAIAPAAKRVVTGNDPPVLSAEFQAAMNEAANKFGITIASGLLPANGDYDTWLAKARRDGATAAFIYHSSSAFLPARRKALADALIKHRLPAICGTNEYVESGCLISYNASNIEFFASAANYVDKILRGAKPRDLPIQQPTTVELVINRSTAKALGISIPKSLLLRADRVIE